MVLREEWHLDTHQIGRRVLVFDSVDSTNTRIAAFANDPANDGLAMLAGEQTAGRGQHGRSWFCEAGTGVLLSVLLFPPAALRRPAVLAAWAANSVCETIAQTTGLAATIKWPNDVLIDGRKVCGILIEQGQGTIVGIGLNVNQTKESLVQAGLPGAGSLRLFTEENLECSQVARLLIEELDKQYRRMCEGDLTTLEECWRARTNLVGNEVVMECHQGTYRGRLRKLSWETLEIDLGENQPLHLVPEVVKHITMTG